MYKILLCLLFICSCSTTKKFFKKEKVNKKKKVSKVVHNYGPTNSGNTVFKDITDDVGLNGVYSVRNYIVDINGDGREDLVILPDYYSTPEFYLKTKEGKFLKSKNVFFEDSVKASFLIFDDFDKDGRLDVLVAVHNQRTSLTLRPISIYSIKQLRDNFVFRKNEKFQFKDNLPSTSISTFDYDYDGFLDFYVGTWFDLKQNGKLIPDKFYTFKDNKITDISGILQGEYKEDGKLFPNASPTYGVSHCDVNGDGLTDILTSSSAGHKNKLWVLEKTKTGLLYFNRAQESGFSDDKEGRMILRGGGNSSYAICSDYNNDGFMDIAQGEVSHYYDPEIRDRSSILTGEGLRKYSSFIRSEYISDKGLANWTQSDQRASWFDYNNDGVIDLLIENSGHPPLTRTILFKQLNDHELVEVSSEAGVDIVNPVGSVVYDHNDDGKLDLLVSRSDLRDGKISKRIFVFENRSPNTFNFIKLVLSGVNSNKNGVGAKVFVRDTYGNEQSRWAQNSYGPFPSGHSKTIHFGLGSARVEEVIVHWPLIENGQVKKSVYKKPFLRENSTNILIEK